MLISYYNLNIYSLLDECREKNQFYFNWNDISCGIHHYSKQVLEHVSDRGPLMHEL